MGEEIKTKIDKYIAGLSDEKERSEMESLFLNGEANSLLRSSLEKDFNKIIEEDPDQERLISNLTGNIYQRIKKNEFTESQKPGRKILRFYMKAAAALLVPLIIAGGLLYINKGNGTGAAAESVSSTINAPLGSRVSFTLPDGTTGMLNSGSSISYSFPFKNERQIEFSGEGWFEVKEDEEHPFIINALNSSIRVLGTSFNLSAYPDEKYLEIVLTNGEVEFSNKDSKEKILLMPSERLILRNGKLSKSVVDTSRYNAWTEGKLVFRGDPMGEVARRIARWYNIDIELAGSQLESYSFRGTFQDDKIEDILKFLAMTSPIDFQIIPGRMMSDGTFQKAKIIIRNSDGE